VVPGAYNLWRGFAFEPTEGNDHQPFLDHLLENVCDGDADHFDYLIKWMANAVQKPAEPGQVAVVLRGDQGTGKGVTANVFGKLFGRHMMQVSNAHHLTGNFNAHLRDCVFLFADEAFYAGDKRHASVLKMIVTEPMMPYEAKGVDTEMGPNTLHVMMASNEDWVVPAGFEERRFFVLDVGDKRKQDPTYFARIMEAMRGGGYATFLHQLQTMDLSGFEVRRFPKTAALRDQKMYSWNAREQWWYSKLVDGKTLHTHGEWQPDVTCIELVNDFLEFSKQFTANRRSASTQLGAFLKKATGNRLDRYQSRESKELDDGTTVERPYVYVFPSLDECRAVWDDKFGGPFDWPEVSSDDG
jgi:hypothetical protein